MDRRWLCLTGASSRSARHIRCETGPGRKWLCSSTTRIKAPGWARCCSRTSLPEPRAGRHLDDRAGALEHPDPEVLTDLGLPVHYAGDGPTSTAVIDVLQGESSKATARRHGTRRRARWTPSCGLRGSSWSARLPVPFRFIASLEPSARGQPPRSGDRGSGAAWSWPRNPPGPWSGRGVLSLRASTWRSSPCSPTSCLTRFAASLQAGARAILPCLPDGGPVCSSAERTPRRRLCRRGRSTARSRQCRAGEHRPQLSGSTPARCPCPSGPVRCAW